ncbi:MAG: PQQ-dependent sugar dehydrogenase, partial [Pseudoclavibacter sp.]
DEPGPVTITTDQAEELATGLDAPWSMARFASGAALVSERDSGRILEVLADGTTREVAVVPGVAAGGEGGLLGLAIAEGAPLIGPDDAPDAWLYAMFTSADDNRIVRFDVTSTASGAVALGEGEPASILTGLPRASNHNGGRLAIGPDGLLYATAGDAGQPDLAQDQSSLGGKILRLELDGAVPTDNPFDNEVYSMGHRNPQGLAWDRDGRLWASEFGQDTWDELNLIEPGANYGWPAVEGVGDDPAFRNPVLQWSTSEASPSGLAWVGDTLFMAGLGGERLWRIDISGGEAIAEPLLVGDYGRIRDVGVGPAQSIWILTNNTDGRGSPGDADDRIVQLLVVRP